MCAAGHGLAEFFLFDAFADRDVTALADRDVASEDLRVLRWERAALLADCNRLCAVIVSQLVSYEQPAIDVDALSLLAIEGLRVVQLQLFILFKTIALGHIRWRTLSYRACEARLLAYGCCNELERRGRIF